MCDCNDKVPSTQAMMRLDGARQGSSARPRPLDEQRPFCKDEQGRPVAMALDGATRASAAPRPCQLEEPKAEK